MKALIISNPFKGTISSKDIGNTISYALRNKGISSLSIPSTDGGDGFLDAFSYIDKEAIIKTYKVKFLDKEIDANYLLNERLKTAYLSLSDTCGIKYLSKKERDPMNIGLYPLGLLMRYIIENEHVSQIKIGIGGSPSIDLGAGFLEGLGVKFYDKNNNLIHNLCNSKLKLIDKVDTSYIDNLIKDVIIVCLKDVNCRIIRNGACDSYALTKGARTSDIPTIRENAKAFINMTKSIKGNMVKDSKYFGAAGGLAFSLFYYLHASLVSGAEEFLKCIRIDGLLKEYDLVITGEGAYDNQTSQGKLINAIKKHRPKKLIIVCGINRSNKKKNIYSIVPDVASHKESMYNPKECLIRLIDIIDFNK